MKITKTVYIQTLPIETKKDILSNISIENITEEEKEFILNSRLCDIEEICDINKYLN